MPKDQSKTQSAVTRLLELGEKYNLGGTGQPIAVVLVYPQQAFVNASWGGDSERENVMSALIEAAAGEGMKGA